MGQYAILSIGKIKRNTSKLENHMERKSDTYKTNHEIRSDLTHLNYHMVTPEVSYTRLIGEKLKTVKNKPRSDSIRLVYGVVGGSFSYITKMNFKEQKEYFDHAFEFLKERFGEENFISAVVHMDENAPHMHFAFVPVTKDGRLCVSDMIPYPRGLSNLQADFYRHMMKKYKDLDMYKVGFGSVHLTAQLYKRSSELITVQQQIKETIYDMNPFNMSARKREAIKKINEFIPEMAKIRNDVKSQDELIKVMSADQEILRDRVEKQKSRIRDLEAAKSGLEELNAEKDFEITRLQNLIRLIPSEIRKEKFTGEKQFDGILSIQPR